MQTSSLIAETSLDLRARAAVGCRRQLRPMVIDSDDDQLERRYTEAQRSHLPAGDRLLIDGTRPKRQMLSALRDRADLLIEKSLPPATEQERPMASECVLAKCGMRAFVTSFAHGCRSPRSAQDELFLGHSLRLGVSRTPDGGASVISDCADKDRGVFLKIAVGRPKADSTRPCLPAAAAKPCEAGWQI